MGIFRRNVTGSTNTPDKKLALRIYFDKHHQASEEHHLPSQRGKSTTFFRMCAQYLEKYAAVNKGIWRSTIQFLGRDRTPAEAVR